MDRPTEEYSAADSGRLTATGTGNGTPATSISGWACPPTSRWLGILTGTVSWISGSSATASGPSTSTTTVSGTQTICMSGWGRPATFPLSATSTVTAGTKWEFSEAAIG